MTLFERIWKHAIFNWGTHLYWRFIVLMRDWLLGLFLIINLTTATCLFPVNPVPLTSSFSFCLQVETFKGKIGTSDLYLHIFFSWRAYLEYRDRICKVLFDETIEEWFSLRTWRFIGYWVLGNVTGRTFPRSPSTLTVS